MMVAMDTGEGSEDAGRRLDNETRRLGLERLAEIRASMRCHPTAATTPPSAAVPVEGVESVSAGWSDPAVMALLMSAGAERERLEQRVAVLEAEVQRLRASLGQAMQVLGGALASSELPSER
jgi:hypothetical protein